MSFIDTLASHPEDIFSKTIRPEDALEYVKQLIDPIASENSVLDEIFIEGLDAAQVWAQVKIVIDGVNEKVLFGQVPALKEAIGEEDDASLSEAESHEGFEPENDLEEVGSEEELSTSNENDLNLSEHASEEDEPEEDEEEEEEVEHNVEDDEFEKKKPVKDAFGLNDEFFSIDDFNKQLDQMEKNNGEQDEEEIDYFGEDDESDDEILYYNDFFKKPATENPRRAENLPDQSFSEDEVDQEEGDEESNQDQAMGSTLLDLFADEPSEKESAKENLSTFEKQQRSIQKEIELLEQEAIAEKKWALKGESKAKDRPEDALLEEDLEFERTSKPVPIITNEVTESLEDLIRRRILHFDFDELQRRVITENNAFKPSSSYELSEQKSQKSLAQIYEDQYSSVDSSSKAGEELTKQHEEISQLFQSLNHKLDALSSAHFIPKPHQKDLEVKVQTAALSMEDAQPLAVSTESTMAPQEVYRAENGISAEEVKLRSGLTMSKAELSREEKQRLRRANKRRKAKQFSEKPVKKSKRNETIDTLAKAGNVTIIDKKGQKTDVQGNIKKAKAPTGSVGFKL